MIHVAYYDYSNYKGFPMPNGKKVAEVKIYGSFISRIEAEEWANSSLRKDEKHEWKMLNLPTVGIL